MHDPVAQRDDLHFDFGVTALGGSFHNDWPLDAATAADHIVQWYGREGDPGPVLLLIEDLLRLRDSGLDGPELDLLWLATDVALGVPGIGGEERASVDHVLSLVVPLARSRGAAAESCTSYPACVPHGTTPAAVDHLRRTPEVVALIGLLGPERRRDTPLGATQDALERCAETVCAELAFRFMICAASTYSVRLSPAVYERCERLGTSFGYGPHLVDAVKYLVD